MSDAKSRKKKNEQKTKEKYIDKKIIELIKDLSNLKLNI